jgi:hypothetical protein
VDQDLEAQNRFHDDRFDSPKPESTGLTLSEQLATISKIKTTL